MDDFMLVEQFNRFEIRFADDTLLTHTTSKMTAKILLAAINNLVLIAKTEQPMRMIEPNKIANMFLSDLRALKEKH